LIQEEVCALLEKGAVTKVPNPQPQESSLLSPQERGPNGTSYQPQEVERVGGIPELQNGRFRDTERATDWMVKVDLKDAYFTVPIHVTHQPMVCFR